MEISWCFMVLHDFSGAEGMAVVTSDNRCCLNRWNSSRVSAPLWCSANKEWSSSTYDFGATD
jgi:hypothetical protein